MVTLKEEQQLPFEYNWKLRAYLPGTVKLGDYREYHSPDGSRVFLGRDIITTTPPVVILKGHNLIVTVGKQQVGDMLMDVSGYDIGLTYCALGANNGAPVIAETQLVDEGGGGPMRKTITNKSRLIKVITLSTFFTAAESTLAILEAAIFGHSSAGPTENSGIMFTRWLVTFDNSGALYDVSIDYELTIG